MAGANGHESRGGRNVSIGELGSSKILSTSRWVHSDRFKCRKASLDNLGRNSLAFLYITLVGSKDYLKPEARANIVSKLLVKKSSYPKIAKGGKKTTRNIP